MIQFKIPIDAGRLRMAYNNDVLHFKSSLPSAQKYCDVTINNTSMRLYPAPDGYFFLNLKPYATSFINTRNFEDTMNPNIQGVNPATYVYNHTPGTYITATLSLAVVMENNVTDTGTYDLAWLAGAEQLGDYKRYDRSDYFVLSPLKKDSNQHYYLKYWQGYPFDISLYTSTYKKFNIKSASWYNATFLTNYLITRLVLSDGRTDVNLENQLLLINGINELRYMSSLVDKSTDKFITLEKVPSRKGVYLKWLNKYGGYSYWLFEDTYSVDRNTKYTGELDRDYTNLEQMFGRSIQIGKESQDTMRVIAELLTEDERRIVEGILDSPKIYLFTGKPFAKNGKNDWIEVTLKTTNSRIKNARQPLTNFTFDIELPQRFTQTL